MAYLHIKVNVTVGATFTPQYTGDGSVLVTVITGSSQAAVTSGATGSTTVNYQIVGKIGENDFWISTGPSSAYCGVSVAKIGYFRVAKTQKVTTAATVTFNMSTSSSPSFCDRYLKESYMTAIESVGTLSPNVLGNAVTNFDMTSYSQSKRIVSGNYSNGLFSTLIVCTDSGGIDDTARCVTPRRLRWNVQRIGAIYNYDPSAPGNLSVYFVPSSFTIVNNNTNQNYTSLGATFYIFIASSTVANFSSGQITRGSSNTATINYVARSWTPTSRTWGVQMGPITNQSGTQVYATWKLTLVTTAGTYTASYYQGNHGVSFSSLPSSGSVNVQTITLEFTA